MSEEAALLLVLLRMTRLHRRASLDALVARVLVVTGAAIEPRVVRRILGRLERSKFITTEDGYPRLTLMGLAVAAAIENRQRAA